MKHFFLILLIFFVGCSKPTADQVEQEKLKKKIALLEEEYAKMDAEFKLNGESDQGKKLLLAGSLELLKSRMDRLKIKTHQSLSGEKKQGH